MSRGSALAGAFLLLWLCAGSARAHESLPAYLELDEVSPGLVDVLWKLPSAGGAPPPVAPVFSTRCSSLSDPVLALTDAAVALRWRVRCSDGLSGVRVELDGLRATSRDALVRIRKADGEATTRVVLPDEPSFVIDAGSRARAGLASSIRLGVEHILFGADHLLFVLGLVLLVRDSRRLVETVTAFTLAHSLTLGLATLGFVSVPAAPVEATIALSIVFLACELVRMRRGEPSLTARRPWLVAFSFGLLHGFGFAGALEALGLPRDQIPRVLFGFNAGVELGQIAFVFALLVALRSLRALRIAWPPRVELSAPYAIGSLAAFWFLQRLVLIF